MVYDLELNSWALELIGEKNKRIGTNRDSTVYTPAFFLCPRRNINLISVVVEYQPTTKYGNKCECIKSKWAIVWNGLKNETFDLSAFALKWFIFHNVIHELSRKWFEKKLAYHATNLWCVVYSVLFWKFPFFLSLFRNCP